MPTARIKIELTYDLANHYGDEEIIDDRKPSEIHNDLEEWVYEDLQELMRGDRLRFWSEIEIEGDN
jgi:hypothetical protein